MLIDEVEIEVRGGKGGNGVVSFGKMAHSGPDGGNGGVGGDVYFKAVSDLTALNQFTAKYDFEAESGNPGGKNIRTGKDGGDLTLMIPVGTSVIDNISGKLLFEMTLKDQIEFIAKGGIGGKGNYEFRGPTNTTPKYAQPGIPGDKLQLKLILKLIANFGIVGLPNAGKSSLLNELTAAHAKIANYPFTTLSPNLGVYKNKVLADIPGLIEGASLGKGLGISFLKHIEKVTTILHCISSESENPKDDYKSVRNELGKYNNNLLEKEEVILLTKSDLVDSKTIYKIKKQFKGKKVNSVSIYDFDSLEALKNIL